MSDKSALRKVVSDNLSNIIGTLNDALSGKNLAKLKPVVCRIGRGGQLPHWYAEFERVGTFPNLDGKTIGSILEMLLVAVLETGVLKKHGVKLRINPARGIDLPDLDLGVKSPSMNYCTSEPFFSAYERLYGNEHDCLILLTDYQKAKAKKDSFKISVVDWKYLSASEVADAALCRIARKHREALVSTSESTAKRVFQFLAYLNQSDWRGRKLLDLLDHMNEPPAEFNVALARIEKDYAKQNKARLSKGNELIPESDLHALRQVFPITRDALSLTRQLDDWVTEFLKDASRVPNDNEWNRILNGPLDGKIGMSFALQWRYNFAKIFGNTEVE
jgi:hypothetical protein